ncbi:TauD/TfdA dioxygenase family protein [Bradyrhizobium sp. PMVTL-01]|uniref:TauD/TfdA dioxygenase family protein n=1 Tax=Bradyrhizobium sp. PMVTL-01 TaxID=3434999 RepID=UPI003F72EB38
MIFFRDQRHLDDAEQERFAMRVGKMAPYPMVSTSTGPLTISELESAHGDIRADAWGADIAVKAYRRISSLRGVMMRGYGGDTVWSDAAAAYRNLPVSLRMLADELWAVCKWESLELKRNRGGRKVC